MDGLLIAGSLVAAYRAGNLLLFALNRRELARLAAAPAAPPVQRRVSVIIPARDEAANIEATLRALLAQSAPAHEILLVDDRSSDGTGEIARRIAAETGGRVIVVDAEHPETGWLGKPSAQAQGVARATGDTLLFIDADVILAPDALAWSRGRMDALGADALALLPAMRRPGFWDEVLQPTLPMTALCEAPLFWLNSDAQRRQWVAAGAFLLVTRTAYDKAGGHAAVRDRVIEDISLAGALKRSGARCKVLDGRTRVSLTMYRGLREYVEGFRKNFASMFGHPVLLLVAVALYLLGNLVQPVRAGWLAIDTLGGAPLTPGRIAMFAGLLGLLAVRGVLAGAIGQNPLYAFTHPLQAAVNGWIFVLSGWDRFVRGKIVWRGREIDARTVRSP